MDMKEEMRLRMLIDITSEHVNKRIKKLKMEKVEFLDWYLYW